MADEITLTIPREPGFDRVAHLVLSGLAVRLNLTIETLEDLQLALDTLVGPGAEGDLTVRMSILDGELQTHVGPVAKRVLDALEQEDGGEWGTRRVLDSTVDDVLVDGEWVTLTKKVQVVG
jgi:hypothetical protein